MNLQWLYSVGVKVARVIPLQTIATIGFTLVSQITLLLAFLLPIKVVILLGSESIPRYFPEFLTLLERDYLIVVLAATSICSYLIHILCERWNGRLGISGTRKILSRTGKFELFDNQNERAQRAYVQYTQAFAALVFLCVGFCALLALYPAVALVIGVVWSVAYAIGILRFKFDENFNDAVFTRFPAYAQAVGNVVFLSVFLFMVADYLRGDPPSILIGLIVLILVRQWTQRSNYMVSNGMGLVARRLEVSAMFFRAQAADQGPVKEQPVLWQVAKSQREEQRFSTVLEQSGYARAKVVSVEWLQTGTPGISCFLVRLQQHNTKQGHLLLVKFFGKQRKSYANNEFTLFEIPHANRLPAPNLTGVLSVDGLACHVFEVPELVKVPVGEQLQAITKYRCALSAVELAPNFISKYHRSHPGLWHRLDMSMLDRLNIVVNTGDQRAVADLFRAELEPLQAFLKNMPESLVNSEATRQNIFMDANGEPLSINWGRWTVEPVGSSWPIKFSENKLLETYYQQLLAHRPAMRSIPLAHMQIAALAWELDRLFQRDLLEDCWLILETLLAQFRELPRPEQQRVARLS